MFGYRQMESYQFRILLCADHKSQKALTSTKMILRIMIIFLHWICPVIYGIHLESDQLVYVTALWRHGDRAPEHEFSTPELAKLFPYGVAELTEQGIEHSHQLGIELKKRYVDKGFLNKTFQHKEIRIQAPDVSRCLMSGETVGQAMFSEEGRRIPFPVPIFSEKANRDYMMLPPYNNCAKRSRIQQTRCPGMRATNMMKKFAEFDSQMMDCLNWRGKSKYFRDKDASRRVEAMVNEYFNGISPEDADSEVIEEALSIYRDMQAFATGVFPHRNIEIVKSLIGELLYNILHDMKTHTSCKDGDRNKLCKRKFMGYSTQDFLINPLLEAFGLKERVLNVSSPKYTATLLLELWKRSSGKYYVKVFYRYGPDDSRGFQDFTEHVDGCFSGKCDFDDFFSTLSPRSHASGKADCGVY